MIPTQSRNINLFKLLTLLLVMVLLGSCALFKKKCPLPTCEIRKSHRHLLIFTKEPKAKKSKKNKKNKNNLTDSTAVAADSLGGDDASHEGHDHEGHDHEGHNHEDDEHKATYVEVDGEVLDEEGNVYVDPKDQKRLDKQKKKDAKNAAKAEKKAAKKKKKEEKKKAKLAKKGKSVDEEDDEGDSYLDDQEDIEDEEDEGEGDYDGMTEDEYKARRIKEHAGDTVTVRSYNEKELAKQLKADDKEAKKAAKKAEKEAKKGSKGESDYTKLYRSRITKWWRRDQNPKTGKHFKVKKNKSTRVH